MIRRAILRWLGIPTPAEIREQILREIDADKAASLAATVGKASMVDMVSLRQRAAQDRIARIALGHREDTRG